MYLKEQKEVKVLKEVITGIKCDVCGKTHNCDTIPDEWHNISMHHNEWGNDSVDSWETFDVCSPKCYAVKFKECVKCYEHNYDGEIDGFEIQFARLFANIL
jgi:hypothetical protein